MRPFRNQVFTILVTAAVGAVVSVTAKGASPVYFPTTGEYYEAVDTHATWATARDAAATKSYLGVQGRLATVNSAEEDDFIVSLMTGVNDSYWVGGYQDLSSPSYFEPGGGWRWITDEPFSYTKWRSGEPSNSLGNEDYLEVFTSAQNGTWNDLAGDSLLSGGYIIEYAVPEPSSLTLLGLGAGIALMRSRRLSRGR